MLGGARALLRRQLDLCLLAAIALIAALVPIIHHRRDADDWTTIAYVQKFVMDHGNVRDPFFGTNFVVDPRYLVSVWARALATISQYSGIGPVALVRDVLPPIFVVMAVLATYVFFRALRNGDKWLALVMTAFVILYFGTTAADVFERQGEAFFFRLAQDKFWVAYVLTPIAGALLISVLRGGTIWAAAAAALVVGIAADIHPISPALIAVLAVPMIGAYLVERRDRVIVERSAIIALVFAIAMVPAAMHLWLAHSIEGSVFFTTSSLEAPAEGATAGQQRTAELAGNRYDRLPHGLAVANRGFVVNGLAVLAAALAPLVAWRRWRREVAARYALLLYASILAVLYLPPVTRLAIEVLTPFQAWRTSFLLPYAIAPILAFGLMDMNDLLRGLRLPGPAATPWLAAGALVAAAAIPGLVFTVRWQNDEGAGTGLYLSPTSAERAILERADELLDAGALPESDSRFAPENLNVILESHLADADGLHGWNSKDGENGSAVAFDGWYRVPREGPTSTNSEVLMDHLYPVGQGQTWTESFLFRSDDDVEFRISFHTENGHHPFTPQIEDLGNGVYRATAVYTTADEFSSPDESVRALDLTNMRWGDATYIEVRDAQLVLEPLGENVVLLAPRQLSRYVPSYAPRAQVVDFRDAALAFPPGEVYGWERRRVDVARYYDQEEINDTVLATLRNYGVTLVIVRTSAPIGEAMGACPRLFYEVGEGPSHTLYYVVQDQLTNAAVCG